MVSKIEESYAKRLLLLPAETQLLVLAAAADPLGDPVLLHRAAETLGIDMAAADSAADAGLLEVGGRVEFAHPLVRSASYRLAPPRIVVGCIALWPKQPTPRRTRIGAPGTSPGPPPGPMKRSRWSWSDRPAARRRAEASQPLLRSCSAPSD